MLRLDAVRHRYAGRAQAALDGVSLQAEDGEILGLLGPNGAGKTTLMSLVAGLLPGPDAGRILLDGEDMADVRRRAPTTLALAPQADAFYPTLTARENLACFGAALGLAPGAAGRAALDQALDDVGLRAEAEVRAGRLSGGQRRRLNLAIALLGRPRLLLLDEPTAGVDPASRRLLHTRLQAEAQRGTTVVFSSHLMGEVELLAARIVILDRGRVLRAGTLAELVADDRQRLWLDLAGATDAATRPALQARLDRQGQARHLGEAAWELQLPEGRAPVDALAALAADGVEVRGARWGRASLEHTFMELTRQADASAAEAPRVR